MLIDQFSDQVDRQIDFFIKIFKDFDIVTALYRN